MIAEDEEEDEELNEHCRSSCRFFDSVVCYDCDGYEYFYDKKSQVA